MENPSGLALQLRPMRRSFLVPFLLLAACARPSSAPGRDIVSLIPQGSVALRDFGLEGRLAGVITDDPVCPPGCIRLGRLGALDSESLLVLKPRILLVSAPGGMLPPDPVIARLKADGKTQVVVMTEPRTVEEALDQMGLLAQALGNPPKSRKVLTDMSVGILEMVLNTHRNTGSPPLPPSRVLLLAGLTPQPGALGPGMLHGSLLNLVAGENVLPNDAPDWLPLDAEAVVKLAPDAIVLLNPDRLGQEQEAALQAELEKAFGHLPIPAAQNHRLRLISDPLCMIPSTNLPKLAKEMIEAVHGKTGTPAP